jgi:DUF1365 family protein
LVTVAAREAALYECQIWHSRRTPVANSFTYGTYLWLVDLDDLPRPGGPLRLLASFRSRDHLGAPGQSIRANVDSFLHERGVDLRGGRVLMLAHARVLGHVFNPLTVYWCHDPDGTLSCVIAEVHNTYGQRHAYLLHPDDKGQARTPKALYVSPFYPVDGVYRMSLPLPRERLTLAVVLDRPDGSRFSATVRGSAVPASTRALVHAAARHPWSTATVSARILRQGVGLYLRGLRPVPRPARVPQEGVQ